MMLRTFGEAFVTLFVITDPIGNAPIFVSITRNLTPRQRQRAALRAVLAAGALIVGFAVFGELILRYLHVSLGSLSIAGGLLLMLVALEMLPSRRRTSRSSRSRHRSSQGPARSRPRSCSGARIRRRAGMSRSWPRSCSPWPASGSSSSSPNG